MSSSTHSSPLLFISKGEVSSYIDGLVDTFQLQLVEQAPKQTYLSFDGSELSLVVPCSKYKPVIVDFLAGKNAHRQQFGGGKGQMICKAAGVSTHFKPSVLDMTAGLGGDAFALAAVGCDMRLQERNAYAAALLYDGVSRLNRVESPLKMSFQQFGDSRLVGSAEVDVVYLDPMYPDTKNKAAVNKAMTIFHDIVGKDLDAKELLPVARDSARYRVVVKRPKKGEFLGGVEPTYQMVGKSSRFDIYVNKAVPTK